LETENIDIETMTFDPSMLLHDVTKHEAIDNKASKKHD
jgi:hypothetical protein